MTVIRHWLAYDEQAPEAVTAITVEVEVWDFRARGFTVEGPFVHADTYEGAVKALEHIAESAEHPSLTVRTTEYLGHVAREALAALALPSNDQTMETR